MDVPRSAEFVEKNDTGGKHSYSSASRWLIVWALKDTANEWCNRSFWNFYSCPSYTFRVYMDNGKTFGSKWQTRARAYLVAFRNYLELLVVEPFQVWTNRRPVAKIHLA